MLTTAQPATYPKESIVNYYETKQSPFFVQFDGTTLTDQTKTLINTIKPRGLILQNMNISNPQQLKDLTNAIHEYGKTLGIKIEIATDEEGGVVSRLKNMPEYPQYNGMLNYLGGTSAPEIDTQEKAHAQFMKQMGIDTNFAPVADIAYSPNSVIFSRSAGNNPEIVSQAVDFSISTLHNNNIMTTTKHFPGHGRTTTDSHLSTPVINISKEEWTKTDAIPFIKAIENKTDYIMIGHLIYPDIDNLAASISPAWIKDILRKELGYKGQIITDDLKMSGLKIPEEQANELNKEKDQITDWAIKSKLAILAGNNYIILILPDEKMIQVYNKWLSLEKIGAVQ